MIEESRITTLVADQLSIEDLTRAAEEMPNRFELIVDDGWHQPEAGLKSLSVFLPRLSQGGYYVVEDIAWKRYRRIWKKAMVGLASSYQVTFRVIDSSFSRRTTGGKYGLMIVRRFR